MAAGPGTTLSFIAEFRTLHDKLRSGRISTEERARYSEARTQFVRMMVISQIGVTGMTLRSDLRMAKMLKVELRLEGGAVDRLTTQEIATKGFATLRDKPLPVGSFVGFTLYLPKPASPIVGRAKVASAKPSGTLVKHSLTFEALHPEAAEQLDIALIDAVLERLTKKF